MQFSCTSHFLCNKYPSTITPISIWTYNWNSCVNFLRPYWPVLPLQHIIETLKQGWQWYIMAGSLAFIKLMLECGFGCVYCKLPCSNCLRYILYKLNYAKVLWFAIFSTPPSSHPISNMFSILCQVVMFWTQWFYCVLGSHNSAAPQRANLQWLPCSSHMEIQLFAQNA